MDDGTSGTLSSSLHSNDSVSEKDSMEIPPVTAFAPILPVLPPITFDTSSIFNTGLPTSPGVATTQAATTPSLPKSLEARLDLAAKALQNARAAIILASASSLSSGQPPQAESAISAARRGVIVAEEKLEDAKRGRNAVERLESALKKVERRMSVRPGGGVPGWSSGAENAAPAAPGGSASGQQDIVGFGRDIRVSKEESERDALEAANAAIEAAEAAHAAASDAIDLCKALMRG